MYIYHLYSVKNLTNKAIFCILHLMYYKKFETFQSQHILYCICKVVLNMMIAGCTRVFLRKRCVTKRAAYNVKFVLQWLCLKLFHTPCSIVLHWLKKKIGQCFSFILCSAEMLGIKDWICKPFYIMLLISIANYLCKNVHVNYIVLTSDAKCLYNCKLGRALDFSVAIKQTENHLFNDINLCVFIPVFYVL